MRLLKVEEDGRLGVTEDLYKNIPPYAVLSHTWGHDNEEVTFKDITEGTGRNKDGYGKIEFCRKQVAADDLKHFWVDTCCIDKSNSTELSEAINSMFRWYKDARTCYVYLSDVSKSTAMQVNEPSRSSWKLDLRKSKWFKRGWTLQELLAPQSVKFFSSDNHYLGDKESLGELLHEITEIPRAALQGSVPLSSFSIEERMSWASDRETKRPEDKAYSLLGIFGVYMLPHYGEGEENAFLRLRKKVNASLGKSVLDRLPSADGAAFDSHAEEHNPTCYPGTRADLLREIYEWAGDPEAKAIFWLNGMAGTGKSTISHTVAQNFSKNQLGASFFFKRGEGDRGGASKFFTTIAAQLVRQRPALTQHVQSAIDANSSIFDKSLREQFERLVLEPCSQISQNAQNISTLVIVVDALDECERDEDVKMIINLFSRTRIDGSLQLRIFVTSRPELPIRLGFHAIQGTYQDLVLHNISKSVIEHDISAFLEHKLKAIRDSYNNSVLGDRQLSPIWPGPLVIQTLTQMASPLFIFAATVCRFLDDRRCGNPDKQLKEILEYQTKSQESQLDATYLPVLNRLLDDLSTRQKDNIIQEFRHIVGSIVILARPLSTSALARMLDVAKDTIDIRLDLLHSVLNIPLSSELPVRLLHLSFRDFLLDPEKRTKNLFWVNEKETHKQLAINCIRVMNKTLRTDICDIQWPGTPRSSIDSQMISDRLQPEVQYACQYWVYHVEQAGGDSNDDNQIYSFLQQHFLHWLEALSLIGRVSESLQMIRTLQSLSKVEGSIQLHNFLTDAIRFILTNMSIIQHAPLQTYCSVLTFTPEKSVIRTIFKNDIPKWVCLKPRVEAHWNACLQTLEGHSDWVSSVAFSADSKLVASGSRDNTVRLWSTDTGDCLLVHDVGTTSYNLSFDPNGQTLHTDTGAISLNVLFSPTRLISTNDDDHSSISSNQVIPDPDQNHLSGYGISATSDWITLDGKNLFWLPADSRPGQSAVSGSTVGIGCASGKVIIMRFLAKGP